MSVIGFYSVVYVTLNLQLTLLFKSTIVRFIVIKLLRMTQWTL